MKISFISFFTLLLCLNADAQSNFYKLGIGAGYGITQSYTDLPKSKSGQVFYAALDYSMSPGLSLGIEYQNGNIRGEGQGNSTDSRVFTNSFASAAIIGKLYLTKWLYIGGGAGIIHNTMVKIERNGVSDSLSYRGNDVSNDLLLPLNTGISYYFSDYAGRSRYGINLNLQYNITLGEGLDGYDNSFTTFRNDKPDIYTYFSVGLSYRFGWLGISKKSLY
ncbi:outer membrane beta-barrel protein [Pedobacter psychroterrae]|uniref:Porin family protein n=1 Tax=Pedobacter psychroterrae TaxID=2530453 RepID=A0A4R0NR08_9SPHI|nr:outer membrane beta-barrel protein [Pedobacter psychroterrae]TCD03256.1 porin family protein [Pedobacter psychroterrae]